MTSILLFSQYALLQFCYLNIIVIKQTSTTKIRRLTKKGRSIEKGEKVERCHREIFDDNVDAVQTHASRVEGNTLMLVGARKTSASLIQQTRRVGSTGRRMLPCLLRQVLDRTFSIRLLPAYCHVLARKAIFSLGRFAWSDFRYRIRQTVFRINSTTLVELIKNCTRCTNHR